VCLTLSGQATDELHNGLVSVVHELTERLQQQERARAELARAYRDVAARIESYACGSLSPPTPLLCR
jgi:hypothetical protein